MSLETSARTRPPIHNPLPLKDREFILRDDFCALAAEVGIPCPAKSVIDKLCAPGVNKGPPPAAYLARRPLYVPAVTIEWLRSLLKPTPQALPMPGASQRSHKRKPAASTSDQSAEAVA